MDRSRRKRQRITTLPSPQYQTFSRSAESMLIACVAAAFGPASAANALPPSVTITSPASGSVTRDQTPSFSGTTDLEFTEEPASRVTVTIEKGGEQVQKVFGAPQVGGDIWTVGPATALEPGTYSAKATQEELLGAWVPDPFVKESTPVTFTIDTTPPRVTLTAPANGSSTTSSSQAVAGSAGTAPGDFPAIAVKLYPGPAIGSQEPIEALTVQANQEGNWAGTFAGLAPGTYTARAEQRDAAGNVGQSAAVTFNIIGPQAPPAHAPPVASFTWFPSQPKVGEAVTLLSSSTDDSSPITGYAWALTSNGPLTTGKPVRTTSFSTPGDHPVRLRVTAADGLSSTVTETIPVSRPSLILMQPFPIVRIAGLVTSSGVFTVQAPIGARIRVSCRGRGCPAASESRVAASSSRKRKPITVVVHFRRFERSLPAGVALEIRVYKSGRIGKYTRFVIRRGKLPSRVDKCVGQAGTKPIPCPSS